VYFIIDLSIQKHPADVPSRRHTGTLRQTSLSRGTPCAFLKVLAHFFEQFKSFTLRLFLHLKQIAPPKLTPIRKSFSSLGACRNSAERQSEEKEKR